MSRCKVNNQRLPKELSNCYSNKKKLFINISLKVNINLKDPLRHKSKKVGKEVEKCLKQTEEIVNFKGIAAKNGFCETKLL